MNSSAVLGQNNKRDNKVSKQMKKLDIQKALEHLKHSANESEQMEAAQGLLAELKEAKVEMPLPDTKLLGHLTAAFRHKQQRRKNRPTLSVTPAFDSWTRPAPAGVRGGTPDERQLLYSQGGIDLDLQIVHEPDSHVFTLQGQLLGEPPDLASGQLAGIEVYLLEPDGHESRRVTDEFGRFNFSLLAAGVYSLKAILTTHDLLIETIPVQEST